MRPAAKFEGQTVRELVAVANSENDYRTLRLFGIDTQLEARCNSGFLTLDEAMWAEWSAEDKAAMRTARCRSSTTKDLSPVNSTKASFR